MRRPSLTGIALMLFREFCSWWEAMALPVRVEYIISPACLCSSIWSMVWISLANTSKSTLLKYDDVFGYWVVGLTKVICNFPSLMLKDDISLTWLVGVSFRYWEYVLALGLSFLALISLYLSVGLYGPDPGSEELFSQTNPTDTGPFGNSLRSTDWRLTWGSRGGCWNQVSTPMGCLNVVWGFCALLYNLTLLCIHMDPNYPLLFIVYKSSLLNEVS